MSVFACMSVWVLVYDMVQFMYSFVLIMFTLSSHTSHSFLISLSLL